MTRSGLVITTGVAILTVAAGQRLAIPQRQGPVANPAAEPLARISVAEDPRKIFQRITSISAEERTLGAKQLGWPGDEDPALGDARLFVTNLDSDEEMEVVFVLTRSRRVASVALIFDHQETGWMQVGQFEYFWRWNPDGAEGFIEFREIIDSGRKEVLVRLMNGGTGVAEQAVTIFRLHKGLLYPIFQMIEESYHTICCGTPDTGGGVEDKREMSVHESAGGPVLLVEHEQTTYSPVIRSEQGASRPQLVGCTAYRWVPERLTFAIDKKASAQLCPTR